MENIQSNDNILCVVCHQPIMINNFGTGKIILEQNYVGCPNGHLVHRDCLKQWIIHSKSCPVCHTEYNMRIINVFNDYVKQVKEDKLRAEKLKEQRLIEESKTVDELDEPEFKETFMRAEKLVQEGNFSGATNIYWDVIDQKKYGQKDPRFKKILLFLSIAYLKMGKAAMAVRQLMKLVKIDYSYPLSFYYLGVSYSEVGLPDKEKWALERSLNNITKVMSDNPSYYEGFYADIQSRLKKLL
jgi:tetratricopeptide (TPR) repeat protein